MITKRQAILKAADHIEQNPKLFDFYEVDVPPDCGTPGCALGWIAHFWRAQEYRGVGEFCEANLRIDASAFYSRMNDLVGYPWTRDASLCAKSLRLYADKYHPEGIPQNILGIFDIEKRKEQARLRFAQELTGGQ